MVPSCLSLVSLSDSYLCRCLATVGLSSQTIDRPDDTSMHFWGFGPYGIWQWRPQIVFFSSEFDLYVPDLLFFGESYAKSSDRSEVFQAVCVTKLLEKLRIQKYYVIGTSYGGLVAYHMAARPKRVEKVVIASSWVNFRWTDNDELLKRAKFEKIEELMLLATAG
ncbi:unnamed protein product [Fraxinus pennsylvanica]|uniref:AB hydrolase-1 domain-containing protein n=1 Tax=Fraxinus pennsylvanica TaxID=56036 RepID=A0AAD2DIE5_9LAMI|nr:unnamed protein product [Fraxinus pennsylvanica]